MNRNTPVFTCSLNDPGKPLLHFWKHTVGSCHATMALRADWQKQMTRANKELGFRHVRFHGLLCDDMGTLMDENDQLVYSFFNADQICDFLLSIGMRPFMELSFMPSTLSSGDDIVFHYKGNVTPPRDYDQWGTLISKLVGHWVDRYGIKEVQEWFFEVWNEPNLDAFWKGSQADYFHLYAVTAKAIKDINASLKVGGPATADNKWIPDFRRYCEERKAPIDFISTHHYPTDDFGQPGDDTIAQLAASKRSALRDEAAKAREESGDLPLYYTEWCTSSNPFDELHDQPYAAAFIMKTVLEARGLVQGYSYWTFTDIFEENYFSSVPFHGGFGLMNIYGIPKPAYRAFHLLRDAGDQVLPVTGAHETVDVWVTRKGTTLKIYVTNWALPRHDISGENVKIIVDGVGKVSAAYVERIDDDHANATAAWQRMNKPGSLSTEQVAMLEEASTLVKEHMTVTNEQGSVSMDIYMPVQGTALVTIETV